MPSILPPYSDADVTKYVTEGQALLSRRRAWRTRGLDHLTVRFYRVPRRADSLGPGLHWLLLDAAGACIGYGYFERDLEWEQDGGYPAWVAQGAFLLPVYQKRGLYPRILRIVRELGNLPLLPDTQQTARSARVWENIGAAVMTAQANAAYRVERGLQPERQG